MPALCRATVYPKGINWVCSGYGDIVPDNEKPSINSFVDHILNLPDEEKWCFEAVSLADNGQTVAQAIREGIAIAVSDGSCKDSYGTAAWVIEGADQHGRIMGKVIAPGGPEAHSPYRSELSGIYATMIVVNNICSFYNIQEGTIEFACDGLSALNRAFSYVVSLLSVAEPSFDMLVVIHRQWVHSTILWKICHVEGHQDDKRPADSLDRLGKLNVEMDMVAKQYIAIAKQQPRHYLLKHDPWSLWYNNHNSTGD